MQIVWNKSAERQLYKAISYIGMQSYQNAVSVNNAIHLKLNQAAVNPERFSPDKFKQGNTGITEPLKHIATGFLTVLPKKESV